MNEDNDIDKSGNEVGKITPYVISSCQSQHDSLSKGEQGGIEAKV